jgi:hypothetical protein
VRALALCLLLSACSLLPDEVRPELEHMSHLTQHPPFTDHETHYGSNMANLVIAWTPGPVRLEVAEGVSLDREYRAPQAYGEIVGPREEFSARISYVFKVSHGDYQ